MARVVGCHPTNRKVTGSIPGQGTCLGCGSPVGVPERGNQLMFLSLFLPPVPNL